jgi:hypothetical protein
MIFTTLQFELLKGSFSMIQKLLCNLFCNVFKTSQAFDYNFKIDVDDVKFSATIKAHLNLVKSVYTVKTQYYIAKQLFYQSVPTRNPA